MKIILAINGFMVKGNKISSVKAVRLGNKVLWVDLWKGMISLVEHDELILRFILIFYECYKEYGNCLNFCIILWVCFVSITMWFK